MIVLGLSLLGASSIDVGIVGTARYGQLRTHVGSKFMRRANVADHEFRYNHWRNLDILRPETGGWGAKAAAGKRGRAQHCVTGAMRAVAAVLLIALFMALTILAVGSWSCSQQAKGEAVQAETVARRDCATVGGTFAAGLHDAGAFVRAYHPEIVAVGIVVIAIFTVILGAFTASLAGSTRVAAGAALLNARAVLEAERARLHVIIERETIGKLANWTDDPGDSDDDRVANLEIAYSFKNYGKTPALIHEIGHKVVIQPQLPKERDYSVPASLPVEPVVGAAATSAPITDVGIPDVTVGTARAIRDSQATLWFYGYVVYDDTYGWRRIFYFEFHCSGTSNGFRLSFCRETEEKRRR